MAITKASASGLAGSKFKDASAGTAKIAALPDTPTIGTATRSGANISVPFTIATRGGTATSFTVTSSPSSITGSGATSPILVSGLTSGTNYTFTVAGVNASGTGPSSAASNQISPLADPQWQLNAPLTFNTTQNYVADANVFEFAAIAFGAGFNGGSGGSSSFVGGDVNWSAGGGGGGGAMGLAYSGVRTSVPAGGETHLITVGAAGGGVTSLGNILTSNGGGNATSKAAGNTQGGNGIGGNIQVGSGLFTVQNYQYGGSGGSGGNGSVHGSGNGGNAGQSPYGGAGGHGGGHGSGSGGGSANGPGGGGGGGGGGGTNGYNAFGGGGGGAGATGRVIIYEKKSV